jgi:hypothetical protein
MITVQARTLTSPARPKKSDQADPPDMATVKDLLHIGAGSSDGFVESLPFSFRDVTAGAENEFQTVVLGKRQNMDLEQIWRKKTMYGKIPGSGFPNKR